MDEAFRKQIESRIRILQTELEQATQLAEQAKNQAMQLMGAIGALQMLLAEQTPVPVYPVQDEGAEPKKSKEESSK